MRPDCADEARTDSIPRPNAGSGDGTSDRQPLSSVRERANAPNAAKADSARATRKSDIQRLRRFKNDRMDLSAGWAVFNTRYCTRSSANRASATIETRAHEGAVDPFAFSCEPRELELGERRCDLSGRQPAGAHELVHARR